MKSVLAVLPSIHAASQTIQCYDLSDDGQVTSMQWSQDHLADYRGRQCVLVVPATCLSWPQVTLPAALRLAGDARLMPALQALVEEVLLDDAAGMHLALPPQASAGSLVTLAACDKAWLAQWMQRLEQAGIKVVRVVPEFAPDALGDVLWVSEIGHDAWVAGVREGVPVVIPAEGARQVWPEAAPVKALPAVYAAACKEFGEQRVQLLEVSEVLQARLATQWNLAQHGFAGTWLERWRRKTAVWSQAFFHAPEWQAARVACVVLAVGGVLALNVQAWRQKQSLEAQQQALMTTVQQTFPQLRVIIDAPVQMQRELQRLRVQAGVLQAGDFEPMAAAVGAALHALGIQPSSVLFEHGQLMLEGIPSARLSELNERLAGSGYRADLQGQSMRVQEVR